MSAVVSSSAASRPIRVVVVDDSSATLWFMSEILDADPTLEVVGTARNADEARQKIKEFAPDVITLDVEMPGMNGIDFLRNLMRLRPMPVVMVSALTERGADVTLRALSLGAVDFVCKPRYTTTEDSLTDFRQELTSKVRVASSARVKALRNSIADTGPGRARPGSNQRAERGAPSQQLIAVGASTGGTEAVTSLLSALPADGHGVVVVQHISDFFNEPFVRRLDREVSMRVVQAKDGDLILRGCAYVAPAGQHMEVRKTESGIRCALIDSDPVNYHRPAVDCLFESVAREIGADALGVILTGMGRDGAKGLARMRAAGATTIAQDERSSVVWGMPGAAVKADAVDEVLPLADIPDRILAAGRKTKR